MMDASSKTIPANRPVNLVADKLAYREEMTRQVSRTAILSAIYAVIGLVLIFAIGVAASKVSTHLTTVRSDLKQIERQLENINSSKSQSPALSKWAMGIRTETQRSRKTLLNLEQNMPRGMSSDNITLKREKGSNFLEISGTALSLEDAATFATNLSGPNTYCVINMESANLGDPNGLTIVKFTCTLKSNSSGI